MKPFSGPYYLLIITRSPQNSKAEWLDVLDFEFSSARCSYKSKSTSMTPGSELVHFVLLVSYQLVCLCCIIVLFCVCICAYWFILAFSTIYCICCMYICMYYVLVLMCLCCFVLDCWCFFRSGDYFPTIPSEGIFASRGLIAHTLKHWYSLTYLHSPRSFVLI